MPFCVMALSLCEWSLGFSPEPCLEAQLRAAIAEPFLNEPTLFDPPYKKWAAKDFSGGYLARFLEGVSDGAQHIMQVGNER